MCTNGWLARAPAITIVGMRLYYMTSLDIAIDHILPEKRLRIARFDSLNDPFELHGVDMGSDGAHVKKTLIEHWTPTIGVLCFGLHWKSPVMWAHYARSHTGVCLGFDVPDDKPQQMQYSKTPY